MFVICNLTRLQEVRCLRCHCESLESISNGTVIMLLNLTGGSTMHWGAGRGLLSLLVFLFILVPFKMFFEWLKAVPDNMVQPINTVNRKRNRFILLMASRTVSQFK